MLPVSVRIWPETVRLMLAAWHRARRERRPPGCADTEARGKQLLAVDWSPSGTRGTGLDGSDDRPNENWDRRVRSTAVPSGQVWGRGKSEGVPGMDCTGSASMTRVRVPTYLALRESPVMPFGQANGAGGSHGWRPYSARGVRPWGRCRGDDRGRSALGCVREIQWERNAAARLGARVHVSAAWRASR